MTTFKEHTSNFASNNGTFLAMLRLIFYPITQTIITPIRLLILLYNSRVLITAKRSTYSGFVPQAAFNALFYWTRALNIRKYGRKGRSPYIGLGNYPLARAFYYSIGSLYSYWKAPLLSILIGMFGWVAFHFVWINDTNTTWIMIIMGVVMISVLFYNNIVQQNYNVLGWLFFPLFLFGIITGQWVLAASALLLASFGSITVVVLGGMIGFVFAIYTFSLFPILIVIPAGLKILLHFIPLLSEQNSKGIALSIIKAIGVTGRDVKYKRSRKGKVDLLFIYFSLLYIQFIAVYYIVYNELCVMMLAGIAIFWMNKLAVRFADDQSIYMLILSLGTASLAIQEAQVLVLISFWIMINPFPLTTNIYDPRNIDLVPPAKPFYIQALFNKMEEFFLNVKKDQRVLLCFDDPQNIYEKLFDGYRHLMEVPHYVANKKEFHFMPGWWGVSELNYQGADDFWGRDPERILKNIKRWELDYIIVYQEAGTRLDPKWLKNGFENISSVNWQEIESNNSYHKFYKPPSPSWWLLAVPKTNGVKPVDS